MCVCRSMYIGMCVKCVCICVNVCMYVCMHVHVYLRVTWSLTLFATHLYTGYGKSCMHSSMWERHMQCILDILYTMYSANFFWPQFSSCIYVEYTTEP